MSVNGAVISSPALNVTPADRIAVDGTPLPGARAHAAVPLSQAARAGDHPFRPGRAADTIFRALPKNLPRLISVGRLDINTEGLLLLTNDGGLARVLELPATGWLRRYRVRALGRVQQEALDRLRGGITVDGVRYGPIEATLDREQGANVWLTFAIREGKNREVRKVLETLGLKVNRLIRVSFGPFELGDLADGAVRGNRDGGAARKARRADRRRGRRRFRCAADRSRNRSSPRRVDSGRRAKAREPGPPRRRQERPGRQTARAGARDRNIRKRRRRDRSGGPRPIETKRKIMRVVGGQTALAPARRAEVERDAADRRPAARSLFNILTHAYGDPVTGARVLDLFAGTGALGIEAISRGAAFALFVDDGVEARALLRDNVETLGLGGVTRIFRRDATKLGPAHPLEPFSLVFLDPPYGKGLAEKALVSAREGGWLKPEALVVVEEAADAAFKAPEGFEEMERRKYDDTEFVFLRTV